MADDSAADVVLAGGLALAEKVERLTAQLEFERAQWAEARRGYESESTRILSEVARLTAENERLRQDLDYHADCRPNRMEAEKAIADAKTLNDWRADVTAATIAAAGLEGGLHYEDVPKQIRALRPRQFTQLDRLAADPSLRANDWAGRGALAITDVAIEAVRRFLSYDAHAAPLPNGGLQIEWHTADIDLELEFDSDGRPASIYAVRASDDCDLTTDMAPRVVELLREHDLLDDPDVLKHTLEEYARWRELVPQMSMERVSLRASLEQIRGLVEKWRATGAAKDTVHATMGIGWKACADDLAAALPVDDDQEQGKTEPRP